MIFYVMFWDVAYDLARMCCQKSKDQRKRDASCLMKSVEDILI